MELLEGLDLGHSMNFYDGKLEKKRWKKEKPSARQYSNPRPQDHEDGALPLSYNRGPGPKIMVGVVPGPPAPPSPS